MHADVDHLRLSIERYPDHWATAIVNRISGACLYRAESTSAHCGRCVLLEFVSCELGRCVNDEDLRCIDEAFRPPPAELPIIGARRTSLLLTRFGQRPGARQPSCAESGIRARGQR